MCQLSDSFPSPGSEEGEHHQHSEYKTDGVAGHQIASVDVAGDQMSRGDPHRPQHQNVDHGWKTNLADPIGKTDDAVEYGKGPGKGKNHLDIVGSHVQNSRILSKQAKDGTAEKGDRDSSQPGDQSGEQRDS